MNIARQAKSVEILLIEDSLSDIRLTQKGFENVKMVNNLHVTQDGETALDFLFKRKGFEDEPRPDLILLDLNLPRKTGIQVLKEIKKDENLRRIPVIILTTSDNDADILDSYNLHANAYIQKPIQFQEFIDIIRTIHKFWFTVVKYPEE